MKSCASWRTGEARSPSLLRTSELVRSGRALLELLRSHIAYKAELLKQIEDSAAAEEKLLRYTHPAE